MKDSKIIKFPTNPSQVEKQVEGILFAAEEPLDIDSIKDKLKTKKTFYMINNQKNLQMMVNQQSVL